LNGFNWIKEKPENEALNGLTTITGDEMLQYFEQSYMQKIKYGLKYWDIYQSEMLNEFMSFLEIQLQYKDLNKREWIYKFQRRMSIHVKNAKGGIVKGLKGFNRLTHYSIELDKFAEYLKSRGFLKNPEFYHLMDALENPADFQMDLVENDIIEKCRKIK
jgi:hypothetical protein